MSDSHAMPAWSPSFIGIGAEKAATTWLWSKLDQHPEIEMSQPKELNYFNENFQRGSGWYEKHFRNSTGCLQGEISVRYMDDEHAADRMLSCFPSVRLLVMLRNPFDRALSHLMHDAQNCYGGVADLQPVHFQTLATKDDKYVRRSCYANGLQNFLQAFPRDQLGIFFYDDVRERPQELMRRVFRFLQVDPTCVPDELETAVNKSQDYRSVALYRVVSRISQTAQAFPVTRDVMEWIHRNTRLRERAFDLLMRDSGRPEVTAADVLSEDQLHRIADDLHLLQTQWNICAPHSWKLPEPAFTNQTVATA